MASESPEGRDQRPVRSGPLPEITTKALVLGVLLSMILAAANAYLGLKVGMTVSASIPAAVISMGILSLFRDRNILENNIVQTAASAGESVAAGVIFVIPALVMTGFWERFETGQMIIIAGAGGLLGVLFTVPLRRALIVPGDLKFPEGVATAEVLRVGEQGGDEGGGGFGGLLTIAVAGAVGAFIKFGSAGLSLWTSTAETARRVGNSVLYFGSDLSPALLSVGYIVRLNIAALVFIGGAISWYIAVPIYHSAHEADFRATVTGIGGALDDESGSNIGGYEIVVPHSVRRPDRDLGVRYEADADRLVIIDLRDRTIVYDNAEGIDTGVVAVTGEAGPIETRRSIGPAGADPTDWGDVQVRRNDQRMEPVAAFVALGAVTTAQRTIGGATNIDWGDAGIATSYLHVSEAAWVIWNTKIRYLGVGAMVIGGLWALLSLFGPIRDGIREGLRAVREGGAEGVPREERDMPMKWVLIALGPAAVALFAIYAGAAPTGVALLMALVMLVAGFLFSAVAGYMAGLVGSSNNPISGVTIATVLFASLLLFALMGSDAGTEGAGAALLIGAVVCCAAAIAGDNMQDLKTGYIVGATPWKQQVMQAVGVVAASLVLAPVLQLLMKAYGFVGASTPDQTEPLAAPQAGLMQAVAEGVFAQTLPWAFIAGFRSRDRGRLHHSRQGARASRGLVANPGARGRRRNLPAVRAGGADPDRRPHRACCGPNHAAGSGCLAQRTARRERTHHGRGAPRDPARDPDRGVRQERLPRDLRPTLVVPRRVVDGRGRVRPVHRRDAQAGASGLISSRCQRRSGASRRLPRAAARRPSSRTGARARWRRTPHRPRAAAHRRRPSACAR